MDKFSFLTPFYFYLWLVLMFQERNWNETFWGLPMQGWQSEGQREEAGLRLATCLLSAQFFNHT